MSWGESNSIHNGGSRAYGQICHQSGYAWYLDIASMALGSLDKERKALCPYRCRKLLPPLTRVLLSHSTGYRSSPWRQVYSV